MPTDREWLRRLAILQCALGVLFCLSLRVSLLSELTAPSAVSGVTVALCAIVLWAPLSRRGDDAKRALSMLIQSGNVDLAGAAPLAEPDLRAAAAMLGVSEIALLVPDRGSRSQLAYGELKAIHRGSFKTYRVPLGATGDDESLGFVEPPGLRLPRPFVVKSLNGQAGELARIVVGLSATSENAERSGPSESLLALLGAWWSMRLDNRRLAADAEQRLLDIVESLITSVEAKDPYTSGHSKRVCKYSELIAQSMGIAGRDLEEIAIGAALHDVGKLGIPEHVLRKPSKLDDDEWEQIKSHPKVGARIIDSFNQSYQVLHAIQHHHEHWNGAGYPGKLAGEAIPLPARIVGVADAIDAMTSSRSYQRNRTVADALEEVRRSAGRQFDPAVVEAVLRIPIAALEAIAPTVPVAVSASAEALPKIRPVLVPA